MTDTSREEIDAEVRQFVRMLVRAGYEELDEIVACAMEYFTGTWDEELVGGRAERALSEEVESLRNAQLSWPVTTDYDRLVSAFRTLRARGIVARENFTCCQTCGMDEIGAELQTEEEESGVPVRGFTFFHIQDTERAVEDGGLYLSFGGADDTEAGALHTAAAVVEELSSHGLEAAWDGTSAKRIRVKMAWQRRIAPA
jgi:hypothetical protein